MGIDYYSCEICDKSFPDVVHYGHCGKCEEVLCGSCYDKMREKYGELGEEHERASWYGEESPNCCDSCNTKDKVNEQIGNVKSFIRWMSNDFKNSKLTKEEIVQMATGTLEIMNELEQEIKNRI